jgi:hypothetical protein
MERMFYGCKNFKYLSNIYTWQNKINKDTTNIQDMIEGCSDDPTEYNKIITNVLKESMNNDNLNEMLSYLSTRPATPTK